MKHYFCQLTIPLILGFWTQGHFPTQLPNEKLWRIMFLGIMGSKEENVAIFRRYIAEISRVGGYRHDISWRNIGPAIFRHLSREIADFSRYIGHLAINRRFFSDISRGQRGSTKVRPATVLLQCLPFCLLLRGFEPQTKRFEVHPLTTWAK